ncbi:MAG TPA: hypothetical protein PKN44_15080 [Bacteroidales bacterium]|nr:hypothetical protein [Bacteroidales bacterium]
MNKVRFLPILLLIFLLILPGLTRPEEINPGKRSFPIRDIDSLLVEAGNLDSGPARMLELSEYSLTLAREMKYPRGILHATYNIALAYYYQSNFRQSFYILDTMLTRMQKDSLQVAKIVDYPLTKSKIYSLIAIVFQESGDFKTSMNYYFSALKIIEKTGPDYDIALIYKGLGGLNMSAGNLRKANEYFEKAIALSKRSNDRKIQFDIYQEQYDYYQKKKRYSEALESVLRQMEISKNTTTPYMKVIAKKNLGQIYFYLGEYNLAEVSLKEIVGQQENQQFPNVLSECYSILSRLSLKLGERQKAIEYARKGFDLANETGLLAQKTEALLVLADGYEKSGNYPAAVTFFRKYVESKDSLSQVNNTQKVLEIQSRFDLDQVLHEKKMLENQLTINRLKNFRKNYFLIGATFLILLLGAISFTLVRKNRFEKKVNQQLKEQQGVIRDQEKIIQEEKESRLKLELEHKNRELASRAMIMTQENEGKIKLIKALRAVQEELSRVNNENASAVDEMIRNLKININHDSWEDFRLYFENVYSGFYQNLEKACPNLTPNEKKLCALLKLNLNTKEIAAITSREIRSIESSRIRLRKKLQLSADTHLVTFLSQF